MPDHRRVKLGKGPAKIDERTLKLAKYFVEPKLPPLPAFLSWDKGIADWGMMMNGPDSSNPPSAPDGLGDCTVAKAGHAVQVWSANSNSLLAEGQTMITPSDNVILHAYEQWDGYVYDDPSTDNGGVILDTLNAWRHRPLAKRREDGSWHPPAHYTRLRGFADCSQSLEDVKRGIQLFGVVDIGLNLPLSAQNQTVWEVSGDPTWRRSPFWPGSWGGHDVILIGWNDQRKQFLCITWGSLQWMTYEFFQVYSDEAYALFGEGWISGGLSPLGFDFAALQADLSLFSAVQE